jgi:RNA polymerase sigma-32 factor
MPSNIAVIPRISVEGNLSRYLEEIHRFPMLQPSQEYMLARSLRDHDDTEWAFCLGQDQRETYAFIRNDGYS